MDVVIGALTFWGGDRETGFTIEKDGLRGWGGGLGTKREEVPRPQAAGSFDTETFPDSRIVSVSGLCVAESLNRLEYFSNQLAGLQGRRLRVTVRSGASTTYSEGRVIGTDFDPVVWGSIASYQVQLWFPDPRKYGELRTYDPGTTVTSHHYGNTDAFPVFTVAGSMASGYTIEGPGGLEFTVTKPVVSGHPHTIDMATGYLMVDGSIVHGEVTNAGTWPVPAGEPVSQTLVPVSGSGTLTVAVKDTFL